MGRQVRILQDPNNPLHFKLVEFLSEKQWEIMMDAVIKVYRDYNIDDMSEELAEEARLEYLKRMNSVLSTALLREFYETQIFHWLVDNIPDVRVRLFDISSPDAHDPVQILYLQFDTISEATHFKLTWVGVEE
jgi:hypothetical protein